jgi:hypothetical protein
MFPLTVGADRLTGGRRVGSVIGGGFVVVVPPVPDPVVVELVRGPLTYADTGHVSQVRPVPHEDERPVRLDCWLVWLLHVELVRSRKFSCPPRPSTAIQYVRSAQTPPLLTGTVFQAPDWGEVMDPCATGAPGAPLLSAKMAATSFLAVECDATYIEIDVGIPACFVVKGNASAKPDELESTDGSTVWSPNKNGLVAAAGALVSVVSLVAVCAL